MSHDARNFAAGVSLPYGYTLVDYTYSWSDYLSTIDNRGWQWRSTGDMQTHRLGLSHVLFRNGDMKTALTGGLQHRIIHNYLDDVLLQGSSRKLTSFSVGLNHTHKFLGCRNTESGIHTGMPRFGAESDHGKRGDLPVNQFRKWSVSASFQRPVTDRVWWLTSAYAQWSPDRLHGVEQLSLGVRVQCVALRSSSFCPTLVLMAPKQIAFASVMLKVLLFSHETIDKITDFMCQRPTTGSRINRYWRILVYLDSIQQLIVLCTAKREKMIGATPYHAKYFAHELSILHSNNGVDRLSQSLFDASVDLNPHQIEAALLQSKIR